MSKSGVYGKKLTAGSKLIIYGDSFYSNNVFLRVLLKNKNKSRFSRTCHTDYKKTLIFIVLLEEIH